MSIHAKFDALVKNLDAMGLAALKSAVTTELASRDAGGAGEAGGIAIDSIRPGMSATEKEQAALEIARVLRERL